MNAISVRRRVVLYFEEDVSAFYRCGGVLLQNFSKVSFFLVCAIGLQNCRKSSLYRWDNTGNSSTPPMNSCIIKSRSLEDILRVSSPPFQLRKLIKLIGFRVLLRRLLQGRLLRLFRMKYFIASILLLLLSWRIVTHIYRPRGRVGTFFPLYELLLFVLMQSQYARLRGYYSIAPIKHIWKFIWWCLMYLEPSFLYEELFCCFVSDFSVNWSKS